MKSRSPGPGPLRSTEHPLGLPGLSGREAEQVRVDNAACSFVLTQLQQHHLAGGLSVRENPRNSLHWELPQEKAMVDVGGWSDLDYDACVFQGSRQKRQRLRHNVEELSQLPDVSCRHLHAASEWRPSTSNGPNFLPTKEEAEYTACLAWSLPAGQLPGLGGPCYASRACHPSAAQVIGGHALAGRQQWHVSGLWLPSSSGCQSGVLLRSSTWMISRREAFPRNTFMWAWGTIPTGSYAASGLLPLSQGSRGSVRSASCCTSTCYMSKGFPMGRMNYTVKFWYVIVLQASSVMLMH